jgi:hypothetical protein
MYKCPFCSFTYSPSDDLKEVNKHVQEHQEWIEADYIKDPYLLSKFNPMLELPPKITNPPS